ncbi:MAG: redox-sensing transcriptional repressor Rex [Thermoleophilia bacterium]|nr:redox-sensing transcriptional repressor Rex [Thermoleophilia bacterium]
MSQANRKSSIPEATVPRLSQYLRKLQEIQSRDVTTISSRQLAKEVGTNPAQIRKDLSYFGEFGIRGVGYDVDRLISELKKCLGLWRSWNVIIIGAGKLGTALALYRGFQKQGFNLIGMFDADPGVVGRDRGAGPVMHVDGLEDFLKKNDVHIAIITTPAEPAQPLIDRVTRAGVPSVLNFAPIRATTVEPAILRQVDLSTELMILSFHLDK